MKLIKKLYFWIKVNFSVFWLIDSFFYDFKKYLRYSGIKEDRGVTYKILMDLHRIEKGMSLPEVRRNYGRDVLERLIQNNYVIQKNDYLKSYTLEVLNLYRKYIDDQRILSRLTSFIEKLSDHSGIIGAGVIGFQKLENDHSDLIKKRHSVRQFKHEIVSKIEIDKAITLARRTPSVCNRQPWRLKVLSEKKIIDEVLKLQNGNIGFRQDIYNLAVITVPLEAFNINGERNQSFIDGGMFSMSFILSLFNLGIASTCLNWAVEKRADLKLHQKLGLPMRERIIMLIAFGYPIDNAIVAASPRHIEDVSNG